MPDNTSDVETTPESCLVESYLAYNLGSMKDRLDAIEDQIQQIQLTIDNLTEYLRLQTVINRINQP